MGTRIVTSGPPMTTWPSDLQVPSSDYMDIVMSLTSASRTAIGLIALEQRSEQIGRSSTKKARLELLEKLRLEILQGECTLVINGIGELRRVVNVVAIRVE